jgi:hypothetical protein
MTTPTHIFTGYLLGQWFVTSGLIPPGMSNLAIAAGILAANAPDVDVFFYSKGLGHRKSPLHAPLNWFIPLSVLTLITLIFNRTTAMFLILIDVNILIHFIMDSISIGQGIRWLYPFRDRDYGIVFAPGCERNFNTFAKNYLRYPVVILEFVFWFYFFAVGRHLFHV